MSKSPNQGFGIPAANPNRADKAITSAQITCLRSELKIIEGSEKMLLALVYARSGREGPTRLEHLNGYEAQLAFEIINTRRLHLALRGGEPRRQEGEASA